MIYLPKFCSIASVVDGAKTAAFNVAVRTRSRQEQRCDSDDQRDCECGDDDSIRVANHSNGGAVKSCDGN